MSANTVKLALTLFELEVLLDALDVAAQSPPASWSERPDRRSAAARTRGRLEKLREAMPKEPR
jgi:hypothetical protein